MALQFIDERFQTRKACLMALKQNGLAIAYVKDQNEEMCAEAIRSDLRSYKYILHPSVEITEVFQEEWNKFNKKEEEII